MPVKFWHTSLRFWFFLSYLITTVKEYQQSKKHLLLTILIKAETTFVSVNRPTLCWLVTNSDSLTVVNYVGNEKKVTIYARPFTKSEVVQ